ncbi:hypothetical protein [Streptomyces sp. NPDC059349]|uniref:hypothetical protein n=1 Tax=Streptomyces sp. NPDC059349 TaxID=3346808 RepID=UPI0036A433B1
MDSAGAYLHDEQCVELLQADGVDVKQVGGEQAAGLGFEEGGQLAARWLAAWRGAETGSTQRPPDGGGADLVGEAAQFAVHAPEAPLMVLGAEPDDQVANLFRHGWASGAGRLRPFLLHQALVPGRQGAR